jgi:hypothetical protein
MHTSSSPSGCGVTFTVTVTYLGDSVVCSQLKEASGNKQLPDVARLTAYQNGLETSYTLNA